MKTQILAALGENRLQQASALTVTSDVEGMAHAVGILMGSGRRTSHIAVVAQQLGKVCLIAFPGLQINLPRWQCTIGEMLLNESDRLALDGNTGAVYACQLSVTTERLEAALRTIASWQIATAPKEMKSA
jgi:pyruvate,orthophosphate dikinase